MPENNNKNPIMTDKELSALFSVPTRTIVRLAKEGKIPAIKVGGKWRFKRDTIERWMKDYSSSRLGKRVLVADGNKDDRQALTKALEKLSIAVTSASSVQEAIDLIEAERPDALILDLKFKGGEKQGIDLLDHIGKMGICVPVVIHTARPEASTLKEVLRYDWFIIISKPTAADQLKDAMSMIFRWTL